jgi:RimJ/RimL family protein N-acetyltransferase
MDAARLRIPDLTGDHVYLRAPVEADKEHAQAWLGGDFPANAPHAEAVFKEEQSGDPLTHGGARLMIVGRDTDAVIGGARISTYTAYRTCWLELAIARGAEDADALRGEALRLVVRWLRDQGELMVVDVMIPADHERTIAAAEEAGMARNVRLREWYARPSGRVDAFIYEALNPRWEVRDA